MDHFKQYFLLLDKAQKRNTILEYYEEHHIHPKCLFGKENNKDVISLTGREHQIAHLLLWKACKEEMGSSYIGTQKLCAAAWLMTHTREGIKINSRIYEKLKIDYALKISESKKGENNPMFGKNGEEHPMYGKHHTQESKNKMSVSLKGKTLGIKRSQKTLEKMRTSNPNKKIIERIDPKTRRNKRIH